MLAYALLVGHVLTMDDQGVLDDVAVVVRDGKVAQISPRATTDLTGLEVVDARDAWLAPALADCHAHLYHPADLPLFLANGVTLVRNMWGSPWHLAWEQGIAEGSRSGTSVVTTTPLADGVGPTGGTIWPRSAPVTTREQAWEVTRRWAEAGYTQVKAYSWLNEQALAGLGEACQDLGIRLVGHCPQVMTMSEAIDSGQVGFEHLTNYQRGLLLPEAQTTYEGLVAAGATGWDTALYQAQCRVNWDQFAELAARLAQEEIWSCPTLVAHDRMYSEPTPEDPRLLYIAPTLREFWNPSKDFRRAGATTEQRARVHQLVTERNVRMVDVLRQAGAPLLVGTDTQNPYVFPGSSVVDELTMFVSCGFTPTEAIACATTEAGRFLGRPRWGRIAVGSDADFVLLEADPTRDVRAYDRLREVFVRGVRHDREGLDRLLRDRRDWVDAPGGTVAELAPARSDQEVVGDFELQDLGAGVGVSRVTCCSPAAGLRQFGEERLNKDGHQRTTTVIDTQGWLTWASLHRTTLMGTETAHLHREASGDYAIQVTTVDGHTRSHTTGGPLIPDPDLGLHAFAASLRSGATGAALTLAPAFDLHADPFAAKVEADGRTVTLSALAGPVHIDLETHSLRDQMSRKRMAVLGEHSDH